jgi:hypothetical protein
VVGQGDPATAAAFSSHQSVHHATHAVPSKVPTLLFHRLEVMHGVMQNSPRMDPAIAVQDGYAQSGGDEA